MRAYNIINPKIYKVPILLSVPHCGTYFPENLKNDFKPEFVKNPDDTDWFVDQLYDFASSIGITMISAVHSRYIIDLNRDPQRKQLYDDGRISTALCPTTTFFGKALYKDERNTVEDIDVQERLDNYYWPYHLKIQEILDDLKTKFDQVLLWDCHSIRQEIPQIHKGKIPDLILSDVNGQSAASEITKKAFDILSSSKYKVSQNYPFMGGYITRYFGKPTQKQHALQLEMSKILYMDSTETKLEKEKAARVKHLLKLILENLIEYLR